MVPVIAARRRRKRQQTEAEHGGGAKTPAPGTPRPQDESRKYVNGVSAALAVAVWSATAIATAVAAVATGDPIWISVLGLGGGLLGLYLLFAVKVVNQWERAVLLRFGKFRGLREPGLFWMIPVVDSVATFVDHRVRATDVTAESALTRDTVPVNVDAIVFWLVWDAEKAILEVESFWDAIFLASQTALREAIGRHDLAEMITEREKLGQQLQQLLDEKTNPWGITVQSVEIRDVKIPGDLEDAMSRQAQAERERQARIILGTAETEIADKFAQASRVYHGNPVAMHLRAMNMLYEAIKEKGSMVIVPSTAVETMGLGGLTGLAALRGAEITGEGVTPPPEAG